MGIVGQAFNLPDFRVRRSWTGRLKTCPSSGQPDGDLIRHQRGEVR